MLVFHFISVAEPETLFFSSPCFNGGDNNCKSNGGSVSCLLARQQRVFCSFAELKVGGQGCPHLKSRGIRSKFDCTLCDRELTRLVIDRN